MKYYLILPLVLLAFFITSPADAQSPQPSLITPTVYCLGSCPTAHSPSPNNSSRTIPSGIINSSAASLTQPITSPAPSSTSPCTATSSVKSASVHAFKTHRHNNGDISQLINLLLQFLIQLLQQLLGINLQLPSIGNPEPSSAPGPSVNPCPSQAPSSSISVPPVISNAPKPSGQQPSSTVPIPPPTGAVYYVSKSGNNINGQSWATAWNNTTAINWSSVPSGATILIDGGTSKCSVSPYDFQSSSPNPGVTCGQKYAAFSIGQNNITIERSTVTGRNGTVVIDGGRDTPIPYCGQSGYSAANGTDIAIDFAGHSNVTIDGMARSGIVVRGTQDGVKMSSGSNNTLRNMELFDNGYPSGDGTDGNNILMGGKDNIYDRLLVHDGGQDEFHSDSTGYDESGSQVINSWMGAMRENPSHPGEPFNDLQVSGGGTCTHADGIQIFAPGTTMSGLTIDHDVFGPGINQGLYPSDSGTGTTFYKVTITNDLFLDVASHNIITDNPVNGWDLDHDTIFATQGGFEIPSNGTSTMTNTIKYGGYVSASGGTWTTSGDIWDTGDSLPGGTNTNPNFVGPLPSGTLPSFPSLRAANFTPQCSGCSGKGSPIVSFNSLLSRIDSLNAQKP